MEKDEKEILADSITKALAYTENNGKPNVEHPHAGKTGELKSIFQFTPQTWHAYAKEAMGGDDVELTPDNETYVVRHKVLKWIDEGKTVSEIASIWNAGNPNAYKQGHKGINKKYGVAYDTPAYSKKVLDFSKQFYNEKSNIDQTGTALGTNENTPSSEPLNNIMNIISQAQASTKAPAVQGNALNPKVGILPSLAKKK